jgi:hypothetical protein
MSSSGLCHGVGLVRSDVSQDRVASNFKVERIREIKHKCGRLGAEASDGVRLAEPSVSGVVF